MNTRSKISHCIEHFKILHYAVCSKTTHEIYHKKFNDLLYTFNSLTKKFQFLMLKYFKQT